jgi:gluconokinase
MIVIVFGVSGSGKTTIGKLVAKELGWKFYEGDDFHSQANIEKMRRGVPLTDEDRQPWLAKLRETIERSLATGDSAVVACSALKAKYRRHLQINSEVKLVYLRGDYALISGRLRERKGHFMNLTLLQSQFADLEQPRPDEDAIAVDVGGSPREITEAIKEKLGLMQGE